MTAPGSMFKYAFRERGIGIIKKMASEFKVKFSAPCITTSEATPEKPPDGIKLHHGHQ
jgi:hypothetical protein